MRVTVAHKKSVAEVKQSVDRNFDQIFTGLPLPAVQFTDQQRFWNGPRMDFSFTARTGFINIPLKGWILVEEKQVTVELDLPSFIGQFLPEQKVQAAVESHVRGLLA
jgi:hypothetical protein